MDRRVRWRNEVNKIPAVISMMTCLFLTFQSLTVRFVSCLSHTHKSCLCVWLTYAAVMWLQGRWAQNHPVPWLIGLSQVGCISSIVPAWGHWLAIHRIEFITQAVMNFGAGSAVNGPSFVPNVDCILLTRPPRPVLLLFAGMYSVVINGGWGKTYWLSGWMRMSKLYKKNPVKEEKYRNRRRRQHGRGLV